MKIDSFPAHNCTTHNSSFLTSDRNVAYSANNALFLSIETAGLAANWDKLPEHLQGLFSSQFHDEDGLRPLYLKNAPFRSEYGQVVCITIGFMHQGELDVRTFSVGEDNTERNVLLNFSVYLDMFIKHHKTTPNIFGHCLNSFALPFIVSRMVNNGIMPNPALYEFGQKPWDSNILDAALIFSFGAPRNKKSLEILAIEYGIDFPSIDSCGVSNEITHQIFHNGGVELIEKFSELKVRCLYSLFSKLQTLTAFGYTKASPVKG